MNTKTVCGQPAPNHRPTQNIIIIINIVSTAPPLAVLPPPVCLAGMQGRLADQDQFARCVDTRVSPSSWRCDRFGQPCIIIVDVPVCSGVAVGSKCTSRYHVCLDRVVPDRCWYARENRSPGLFRSCLLLLLWQARFPAFFCWWYGTQEDLSK